MSAMETIFKKSWRLFLDKFQFFKMDSATGFFLSFFRTPFYDCFQALNRSAFL